MSILRRVARLFRQSRIRLPPGPLHPEELRPGDWVQLGSETWRVAARTRRAGSVSFRLEPVFLGSGDTAGAKLEAPSRAGAPWTLRRGESEVPLPPELLIVFSFNATSA